MPPARHLTIPLPSFRRLGYTTLAILALVLPASALIEPPRHFARTSPFNAASPPPILPAIVPIILPHEWWEDAAVRLGAQDIGVALKASHGSDGYLQKAGVHVTTGSSAVQLERRTGMPKESYRLEALPHLDGQRWNVAAGDPLGAAYGLFRLANQIRISPQERIWSVDAAPAMSLRFLADPLTDTTPSPEEALRFGFNAIAIAPWPSLALYTEVEPAIYDPELHPVPRAWVDEQRRRAQERIAAAKSLHLQVAAPGDLPSLPHQALNGDSRVCLNQPSVQNLVRAGLDEVLRDFPDIDHVLIRIGENYPLGPLTGTRLPECGGEYVDAVADSMAFMSEITQAHGKGLIFRAWDLGSEGLHASPAVVEAVAARYRPSAHIIFSFKHTQTDFWRYNPPNPNLGRSGFAEMVEFQVAREYEGKGAFPNYLGQVFASGAPEAPGGGLADFVGRGVDALWVWPSGGGWGGPTPSSSLWNQANVYALARLAWEPATSPELLAQEWATLRFGHKAAPHIARLLFRSSEAARLAFYIGPAAEALGPWAPNALWVRDDQIGGTGPLRALYAQSHSAQSFQRALDEKRQAVSIVAAMQDDLSKALPLISDRPLAEQVRISLVYERTLVETLYHQVAALFYTERWREQETPASALKSLALLHLDQWETAWSAHKATANIAGAPTPYNDAGMVAGMAELLAILGASSTQTPD